MQILKAVKGAKIKRKWDGTEDVPHNKLTSGEEIASEIHCTNVVVRRRLGMIIG